MQRIACITHRPPLLPLFSAGIRHNSTEVSSKPIGTVKRTVRAPVARLGDVVIPSIEEVRAKAAASSKPSYTVDISYLDNASSNYLAAKLARLGRGDTIEENRPDEAPRPFPTPEDIAALTAKRREERQRRSPEVAQGRLLNYFPVSDEVPRQTPTPDNIAALTAKRREERQRRSPGVAQGRLLNYVPVSDELPRQTPTPDNIAALTAKRQGERQNRSPGVAQKHVPILEEVLRQTPTPDDVAALTVKRREERQMRSAEVAQEYLLNYVPVPEKSELLRSEFAKSNVFMSPERKAPKHRASLFHRPPQVWGAHPRPQEQLGPSPRRNEWPRKQHEKGGLVKRPQAKKSRNRPPVARATKGVTPSIPEVQIDESVFEPGGHEPEFNGPERPSSTLLDHFGPSSIAKNVIVVAQSGTAIKIPFSKVDSFYKGGYSRYVTASNEDYASPPDALGAVKLAERTLSHQRHYNLIARDRTLELVAQATQSSKPLDRKLPDRQ